MSKSLHNSWKIVVAVLAAFCFAQIYLTFLPLYSFKPIILYSLPILIITITICIAKPNALLVIILFSRSLLDVFLVESRVNIFGLPPSRTRGSSNMFSSLLRTGTIFGGRSALAKR